MRLSNILSALILFGMVGLVSANERELRTWTDSTGEFSFEGTFVKVSGSKVLLTAANGQGKSVPLHRLSPADQEWVNEQVSGPEMALSEEDPLTGVAWYSSVEPAFAEAKRSR
ncbi:MAG: SHD1 domain-containing protein, partial [Verrucomicrobiota bacterium]